MGGPFVQDEKDVTLVRVSEATRKKAAQIQKFMNLSAASHAWGKDQKLLRSNILLVPTSINYRVVLAMGRRK